MTELKQTGALRALLLDKLSPEQLTLLRGEIPKTEPGDYSTAVANVMARLPALRSQVARSRALVRERYSRLEELPDGRRSTLLENAPPLMLLSLAYELVEQSYAERFENVGRCLRLAELAVEISARARRTGYLTAGASADLEAAALMHLGNARRINSDLKGAERALDRAEQSRRSGTQDRALRIKLLNMLAALRNDQGRAADAAELLDQEIALCKLMGDEEKLGEALFNRGVVSVWFEPLGKACQYLKAGVERLTDPTIQALALLPLAETLARQGKGSQAWNVACRADTALTLAGLEQLRVNNRSIKGVALRVLGRLSSAAHELEAARDEFLAQGRPLKAAVSSLDLACVYAAQGRVEEVKELATYAYEVFAEQAVGKEMRKALRTLESAIAAEGITEQLLVGVVNFLTRYQQNRRLHFELPGR